MQRSSKKVYDVANPEIPALLHTISVGNAFDVISFDQRLVAISDKGLFQYDTGKPGMPLLSMLPLAAQ